MLPRRGIICVRLTSYLPPTRLQGGEGEEEETEDEEEDEEEDRKTKKSNHLDHNPRILTTAEILKPKPQTGNNTP